ncbi:hypothetical protein ACFE04_008900 [Oxalis oulophora]
MAFCNKLGGLLKTYVAPSPMASMLNSIRCMSESNKLFVGGLSWGTDDYALKDAFSSFGQVHEAKVILDRETGRSKGFGFVTFAEDESAKEAQSAMDGKELQGRSVRVNFANPRPPAPRYGNDNFSGGYGNNDNFRGGGGGGGYDNSGF